MKPIDEHNDDKPVGRVLSRREALRIFGGIGAVAIVGAGFSKLGLGKLAAATPTPSATALPACVVRPELTEGPYFVDDVLNRSDIRIEPSDGSMVEGIRLRLVFQVSDVTSNTCQPLEGAQVDVWHCDALGVYSGFEDMNAQFDTSDKQFLRGYQLTDKAGVAEFITIYPGWYQGRAVHIHFKIRTDPDSDQGYEFTSQFFFDDALSDEIFKLEPYVNKGRERDMRNEDDNIFQQSDDLLTLTLSDDEEEGYVAIFDVGLDTSQLSSGSDAFTAPSGGGQPPRGTPPVGGTPGQSRP